MRNKNLAGNLFTKKTLRESETSLSAKIAKYLTLKKAFVLRLNSGKVCIQHKDGRTSWMHLCPKGTPDRLVIYKGFHVFLEIKKQGEKISSDQLATHQIIEKVGGNVQVINNFDQVINLITWIDKQTNSQNRR